MEDERLQRYVEELFAVQDPVLARVGVCDRLAAPDGRVVSAVVHLRDGIVVTVKVSA